MQFNTEVLTRPLTPAETSAIKERARQGRYGPVPSLVGSVVGGVLLTITSLIMFAVVYSVLTGVGGSSFGALPTITFVALPILMMVLALVRRFGDRGWLRLAAFADANGLSYRRMSRNPYYPGLLFGVARTSAVMEHVFANSGTFADAGSYTYQVRTGENSTTTYVWYYAAFRLPRLMPHIVLDATANNSGLGSNLPIAFDGSQVVQLGDPFDQQYRLYAPGDYQLDAFYMFPPDLMEMLMQAPIVMDIEIIDSWMFLYTKQPLDLTKADTWHLLGHIDDTIVARMNRIDVRYYDSRVAWYEPGATATQPGQPAPAIGPGQAVRRPWIAPPGQRLRRSSSGLWIALILLVVAAVPVLLLVLGGLMALR